MPKKTPAADAAPDSAPAQAQADAESTSAAKKPKTARVWEYIKKNQLQDKSNRR